MIITRHPRKVQIIASLILLAIPITLTGTLSTAEAEGRDVTDNFRVNAGDDKSVTLLKKICKESNIQAVADPEIGAKVSKFKKAVCTQGPSGIQGTPEAIAMMYSCLIMPPVTGATPEESEKDQRISCFVGSRPIKDAIKQASGGSADVEMWLRSEVGKFMTQ
ncbi:hypothetical protein GO001_33600 [Streptomyces sp. NRRL B-1677]|uniref:hypothetical protein n=1 Tax=Streptomyces sp. NRRL B-1677 TaxID=2682966 RepID=UPI001892A896|nr:hypothetical protein [Streptomyces sp. NRRL B-1677]MBF6050054.1 hypothetical protein [Streptomyces sp. NRRL B-1677]